QIKCLARELDVVRNIWLLANQFVRLDHKAVHIPAKYLDNEITHQGRNNGSKQSPSLRRPEGIAGCDSRAQDECGTEKNLAWKNDVRVSVRHAGENRVTLK